MTLAPDGGIGQSLYSGLDYLEYYSQFPAHNTVCVDGVSSYPVMKSHHPFTLSACFPESGVKGYVPLSYTDIDFIEPETMSEQNRLTGIVEMDSTAGYYIDIFRSRRKDGKDRTHDYFYHNLGQAMAISDTGGYDLGLMPTEELAFAGAHLYAYSYIYDKKSAVTDKDLKTVFTVNMPDDSVVEMNMWMKGEADREVFSALAPMTEGLTRTPGMPYDIAKQPTLTFVARQRGEAWDRPFVAVFEPVSTSQPGTIVGVSYPDVAGDTSSTVAVKVSHSDGTHDMIVSSDNRDSRFRTEEITASATYSFLRSDSSGPALVLLGDGTFLKADEISINSRSPVNVLLRRSDKGWEYRSSGDARLSIGKKVFSLKASTEFISL